MSEENHHQPIGIYDYVDYTNLCDAFQPFDSRFADVAAEVATLIEREMPDARVEHVGSTAIPGCGGKGIIDLLLLYQPGRLAAARDAVDGLGFQRQVGANPFPEERPLRVGACAYDGKSYKLHIHVVAASDPEARGLIYFRDRISSDQSLIDEYVASKLQALETIRSGSVDTAHNIAYNDGKNPFIKRILDELRDEANMGDAS